MKLKLGFQTSLAALRKCLSDLPIKKLNLWCVKSRELNWIVNLTRDRNPADGDVGFSKPILYSFPCKTAPVLTETKDQTSVLE